MKMEIGKNQIARRLHGIATGGAATIAASTATMSVLRIISSMTLTRLLDSHAYGVVAVVTSISYMITMLTEVGLYAFIVRHREGDQAKFLDEVWTIRLLRGFGLSALMAALCVPAANLFNKPELAPVVAVWSLTFALDGMASLSFATAVRGQKLWRLSMLDVVPGVATLVISIAVAIVWRSYWSLIIGMLGGAVVKSVLSYTMFPGSRRHFRLNFERSRELWKFSRYIAASSFLSLLINQSDKVVLARIMPLHVFGLYSIAVTLSSSPSQLAARYATRVLFATYSKTARLNRAGLRKALYDARRKVGLLYMFGVSAMITLAPALIELLYDQRYRGVVPYLQWMTISAVLRLPVQSANQALIADGRTRSTLYANFFRISWLAAGLGLALYEANMMILVAAVGTIEVPAMICFWVNLERAKLLNVREELYGFGAAISGLAIGFAGNALVHPFLR